MKLIVGLGNPGEKYKLNRHNIGFLSVGALADEYGFDSFKQKFKGVFSQGIIGGEKAVLLMPHTFMNLSGESVRAACDFYKIEPADVIVIHDELDIDPARIKIKTGGGDAGHNGLKSITKHLGTPEYVRVRFGIGHPGEKDKVSGYVLNDFSKAETSAIEESLYQLTRHFPLIIKGENAKALNELNK